MSDAASFDAIMQCNLLEIFCEALGAALFVTDNRDQVSFASVRLQHLFPIADEAIRPGKRTRDLYSALFDAGCRLGVSEHQKATINRDEWIAERVAIAWRERVDTIEPAGPGRWLRMVSRRFPSGLGLTIFIDVSEHRKKENLWRAEQERVRLTEEILDALPVAVAVKDRYLNFAAVNQKFCALAGKPAEALIGHDSSAMFNSDFAAKLTEADRNLLKSGTERQSFVHVFQPDGSSRTILHRARRIGRPESAYLAMSFEDVPVGDNGMAAGPSRPDIVVHAGAAGDAGPGEAQGSLAGTPRRVLYVWSSEGAPPLAADHQGADVEVCVVKSPAELTAFLPALEVAGLPVDLVVIVDEAISAYAAIAARHDVPFMVLGEKGIASTPAPPPPAVAKAIDAQWSDPSVSTRPQVPSQAAQFDILVVEDNPINQLAIEQIFGSLGLDYVLAATAEEGLAKVHALYPALIFADATLPDASFDDFAKAVSKLYPADRGQPAMIALLTKGIAEQQQAPPSIVVDSLIKPLSPDAVDLMVRKHLLEFCNLSVASAKTAA